MNECERTNNGLNNYVVNLLRLLEMMLDLGICYHRVSLEISKKRRHRLV